MRKWVAIRVSAALAVAGSVATLLFSAAMAAAVLLTPAREVGPLAPEVMKIAGVAVPRFSQAAPCGDFAPGSAFYGGATGRASP